MDTTALPAWLSALPALPDSLDGSALVLGAGLAAIVIIALLLACAFALARSAGGRRRLAEDLATLQTDKALAEERLAQIRQRLGDMEQDLAEAQEQAASLASENRDLVQNGASLQSQVELLQMDKAQLQASLDHEVDRGHAEAERRASEMASLREENARLAQQMAGIEELRARDAEDRAKALEIMEARLGDFGRQMLAERAEDLRKRSAETLTLAVAPLAQQLDGFRSLVARTAQHSSEQAGRLAEQIAGLQSAQASLSKQAEDLVHALAKGGKAQGLWGERQLEKVLDASGLEAGRDYVREADAQDGDGKKLRPDCVVRLPHGRHLVVDAKCSLTAYAEACAAESEEARRDAMARHVKSVRAHVKELAAKRYGELACFNAPGFVFMFVPIDGALSGALQAAPGLYDEAQREGVYLVSPSTLLPALRVAASLWMLARQNERVQAIAASAGRVHDRLAAVLGALADTDKRRQALNASFDTLASRLQHGSRSLASMLEAFSAKASLEQVKAALDNDAGELAKSPSASQAGGKAAGQAQGLAQNAPLASDCQPGLPDPASHPSRPSQPGQRTSSIPSTLGTQAAKPMPAGQTIHAIQTDRPVPPGQPVHAAQDWQTAKDGEAARSQPASREAAKPCTVRQGSLLATAIRRDPPRQPASWRPSSSVRPPCDEFFPVWDEPKAAAPVPEGDAARERVPEPEQDRAFLQDSQGLQNRHGMQGGQLLQERPRQQGVQNQQDRQERQGRQNRQPERISEFALPGESEDSFWQAFPKAGSRRLP